MSPNKRRADIMRLYVNLMEEVKVRLSSIQMAIDGRTQLPPVLMREYCYLQLRMSIELVAFGCLAAHGDIPATHTAKLMGAYSADEIMKNLDRLHPDFYPVPCKRTVSLLPEGNHEHHVEPIDEPYLDKQKLLKAYSQCGNYLHRGSLKKLLKENRQVEVDLSQVKSTRKEMMALLNEHCISLLDPDVKFLCVMEVHESPEDQGRVQVVMGVAVD